MTDPSLQDVEEARRLVQGAIDEVTRKLGVVGDAATNAVEAGGRREGRGRQALPHLEDALAVMGVVTRNSRGRVASELFEEVAMVDRCLARAARELRLDYDQL